MKHQASIYAKALVEAAASVPKEKDDAVVSNFLKLVKKNGDMGQVDKIVRLAQKSMAKRYGRRILSVESARPLGRNLDFIKKIAKKEDIIEEKINPGIIAGVKITINGEMQFDGSLDRKLKKLFA